MEGWYRVMFEGQGKLGRVPYRPIGLLTPLVIEDSPQHEVVYPDEGDMKNGVGGEGGKRVAEEVEIWRM